MRVLALDIGERRIGLAVSDPAGRVATPLKVLDARVVLGDASVLRRVLDDYEVERVVVGLPLTLSGDEGPQARIARKAGEKLAAWLPVPVVYWDERLSSAEARRVLSESGVRDADKRGRVDMIAAAVFLQSYLDSTKGDVGADGS